MLGVLRLEAAQLAIAAHQRQKVKPEWRGIFCPCWEGGLAMEPSWAVPGACVVVA